VTLTTSPHSDGVTYALTVNDVTDRASSPNIIAANTKVSYTFVAELVIGGLTVYSGEAYEVVQDGLVAGALVYIDRSFTFSSIPASLEGATYIKTANDDKCSSGDSFLSFDVNQDVTIYVAHDNRIAQKPSWLASFTDSGDDLITTDTSFSLFAKDFPAGTVTLGGNEACDLSMYMVVVVGKGSGSPPPAPTGLKIIHILLLLN
jgi:hypothetical protein